MWAVVDRDLSVTIRNIYRLFFVPKLAKLLGALAFKSHTDDVRLACKVLNPIPVGMVRTILLLWS